MNTKENNTPQKEEVVKNPEAETAQTQTEDQSNAQEAQEELTPEQQLSKDLETAQAMIFVLQS